MTVTKVATRSEIDVGFALRNTGAIGTALRGLRGIAGAVGDAGGGSVICTFEIDPISQGDVFVCVVGMHVEGNDFANNATSFAEAIVTDFARSETGTILEVFSHVDNGGGAFAVKSGDKHYLGQALPAGTGELRITWSTNTNTKRYEAEFIVIMGDQDFILPEGVEWESLGF